MGGWVCVPIEEDNNNQTFQYYGLFQSIMMILIEYLFTMKVVAQIFKKFLLFVVLCHLKRNLSSNARYCTAMLW